MTNDRPAAPPHTDTAVPVVAISTMLRAKQSKPFLFHMFNEDDLKIRMPAIAGDVGYDLVSIERVEIGPVHRSSLHRMRGKSRVLDTLLDLVVGEEPPPSFSVIRTGVHVEMPAGYWGAILPRSSSNKSGMLVPFSVIDNGYRGELFPMVHNLSNRTLIIEHGQRVAQFVMFPMVVLPLLQVEELSPSTRGINGFGSTG